jgi:protein-tyrosine phosphatase
MSTATRPARPDRWIALRYGALFVILGVSIAALGALIGGAGLVLLWPALSFTLVGLAYFADRPTVLGKRADGTIAAWSLALLAPYALLALILMRAERLLSPEDAFNEVAPGLWVGRWPRARELPAGARRVVDLTAELVADRDIRARETYLCAPTLDGTAPDPDALRSLVARLRDETGLFIHCASGHGRSATLAAALLIARGAASSPAEAEALMQKQRPGIRINALQKSAILLALAPGAP